MDNIRATLVVFSLSDPHCLEGWKWGQNGGAQPARVHALGRSKYLNLMIGRNKCKHFVPQTFANTLKQRGATRQNHILEHIAPNLVVTFHNRIEAILVDTLQIKASVLRLEQDLWAAEPLIANQNLPAIGQLVVFVTGAALLGFSHGSVVVGNHIADCFLHIADNFKLSRRCKREATLIQNYL